MYNTREHTTYVLNVCITTSYSQSTLRFLMKNWNIASIVNDIPRGTTEALSSVCQLKQILLLVCDWPVFTEFLKLKYIDKHIKLNNSFNFLKKY